MVRVTHRRLPIAVVVVMALVLSCIQPPNYVEPPADSYAARSYQVVIASQTEEVPGAEVTSAFFPATKARPLLGRVFTGEEFRSGTAAVAVLHHNLWVRKFKSDPSVIGTSIQIDGRPHVVVGIMPREFTVPPGAQIWTRTVR
jgi:hypothetical protein